MTVYIVNNIGSIKNIRVLSSRMQIWRKTSSVWVVIPVISQLRPSITLYFSLTKKTWSCYIHRIPLENVENLWTLVLICKLYINLFIVLGLLNLHHISFESSHAQRVTIIDSMLYSKVFHVYWSRFFSNYALLLPFNVIILVSKL